MHPTYIYHEMVNHSKERKNKETKEQIKMLSLNVATPSLKAASVQYQRRQNLRHAWRGSTGIRVACTADVGSAIAYSVPVLEIGKEKDKVIVEMESGRVAREMTLGEKMRFGGLEEDELVYKERFVVRSSQVGIHKTATIQTIASFLQEASCNRSQRLACLTDGFPTPPVMRKHRLMWFTSRMHIEMYQYPIWGDVVEIEHWWEPDGKLAARFDSIVRNLSTGEVVGRATSKYLMVNQDTRKIHKIKGEVRDEFLALCTKSSRLAFPEKNNGSLKKIPKLDDPADYSRLDLVPRKADMDMNKHVNNVVYISWLLQSIPQDVHETYQLQAITLEYQKECHYNDSIDSLSSNEIEEESLNESPSSDSTGNSESLRHFIHSLKFSSSHRETNRGRTVWRKLEK